jgi:hypothetical protein
VRTMVSSNSMYARLPKNLIGLKLPPMQPKTIRDQCNDFQDIFHEKNCEKLAILTQSNHLPFFRKK